MSEETIKVHPMYAREGCDKCKGTGRIQHEHPLEGLMGAIHGNYQLPLCDCVRAYPTENEKEDTSEDNQ